MDSFSMPGASRNKLLRDGKERPSIGHILEALKHCAVSKNLSAGERIHAQVMETGDSTNMFVASCLVDMYAKCGRIAVARQIFDEMPRHDAVAWNSIISGYGQNGEGQIGLELYYRMQELGECSPTAVTILAALKTCVSLAQHEQAVLVQGRMIKPETLRRGKKIHSEALKLGFMKSSVTSSLVDLYAKCGSMLDAQEVFESVSVKSAVLWNCLILGYANNGEGERALELYRDMQRRGCFPTFVTSIAAFKACSCLAEQEVGTIVQRRVVKSRSLEKVREVHSTVTKKGHLLQTVVANTLVDLYCKCGSLEDALQVFETIPRRTAVSWNCIVSGCIQCGEPDMALELYARMQQQDDCPADATTLLAVLKACGKVGALETGKQVHVEIFNAGLESDAVVATSLVSFYAACGSMKEAEEAFSPILNRDVALWGALIEGYSRQGATERVFAMFQEMKTRDRLRPDGMIFSSILATCSHAGLVEKGKSYFESMSSEYGLAPDVEHYNCMVDILGRANELERAVELIESMPMGANAVTWTSLLDACLKWENAELGKVAFQSLVKLDDRKASAYVLLSELKL